MLDRRAGAGEMRTGFFCLPRILFVACTHNHPSGGPLGYSDMDTALHFGAKELRAVGPEQTHILELSKLPTESRNAALASLAEIRTQANVDFKAAHPDFNTYAPADKLRISSNVLVSMVQQLAQRYPNQIRYTVVPTYPGSH